MTQLGLTIAAADRHGWKIILLGKESKKPASGGSWTVTQDIEVIRTHPGNIGVVCGPSNLAVLDFDNLDAMRALYSELGELTPWVETGSYKFHCYTKWVDGLPAKIQHNGVTVGEVQRGNQYVVMPPSVHPVTRQAYRWLVNPTDPIPELPQAWLDYLLADATYGGNTEARPKFMAAGDLRGVPAEEPWEGPSADEILRRAQEQPGARMRRNGIKFQCSGCVAEGHDKSRDNAIVYLDGRWGCAVGGQPHRRAIATQLRIPLGMAPLHRTSLEEGVLQVQDNLGAQEVRDPHDDAPMYGRETMDPDDKLPLIRETYKKAAQ